MLRISSRTSASIRTEIRGAYAPSILGTCTKHTACPLPVRLERRPGRAPLALALLLLALGQALPVASGEAGGKPAGSGSGGARSEAKPRPPQLKTRWGDLPILPADNPWNQTVDALPVHPDSANFIASIGPEKPLHPDFGTVYNGAPNGIPFVVVPGTQPKVPVKFEYADESDPGPYPIPEDAPIEGGPDAKGDRHILVLDFHQRKLYELFSARKEAGTWRAGSGAIWDLAANQARPAGWTSADAAGLPVFPGLVRYDEAAEQGEIRHALRFTVQKTQRAYIPPATHFASKSKDPRLPPMGLRVRLKADFDDSKFPKHVQAITRALKRYGMFLADNGGDWFLSGAPDPRWNDDDLRALKRIKGQDLEAVQTGKIVNK